MLLQSYRAQWIDGHLHVYDVPLFCECELAGRIFDAAWIDTAFENTARLNATGYRHPLHVVHHGTGEEVLPAGEFMATRSGDLYVDGMTRRTIFGTLVLTCREQAERALNGELPWRSIEITPNDEAQVRISSCALLDKEPPWCKFPNMRLRLSDSAGDVGNAKNELEPVQAPRELVIASEGNQAGASSRLLSFAFSEPTMPNRKRAASTPISASDTGEDKPKDDAAKAAEGAPASIDSAAFDAILEAISNKQLTVEQQEMLLAALAEAEGEGSEGEAEGEMAPAAAAEEDPEQKQRSMAGVAASARRAAPARRAPRASSSEGAGEMTPQARAIAAAEARATAAEIEAERLQTSKKREVAIGGALLRFHGRPMGSRLRERLCSAYDKLGPEGFEVYLDDLSAAQIGMPIRESSDDATRFSELRPELPPEVLAFSAQGEKAVRRASEHAATWAQLHERNLARRPLGPFLASAMQREGFQPPAAKA